MARAPHALLFDTLQLNSGVMQHHTTRASESLPMEIDDQPPEPAVVHIAPTRIRGRAIVLRVVALMVTGFLVIAAGVWVRGAAFNPLSQLGRPFMFLGLTYLAWKGRGWARTLLVFWMGLIAISFAFAAIGIAAVSGVWAVVTLAIAGCAAYGAFMFHTSNDVRAFLCDEKEGPSASVPAA